jgi:putative Holliday junction resolvase
MIFGDLREFRAGLRRGSRLLGLDVGSKTIGLALSDVNLTIASPYDTIRRRRFSVDAEALDRVIGEQEVGGLVIGLPVSMDGTEGPRCQSVRQFARNVIERTDRAILFWDERLSTQVIQRMLVEEADMTRQRRAVIVDKLAAAYILQGALDALNRDAAQQRAGEP